MNISLSLRNDTKYTHSYYMECESVPKLSNGIIFNDLERPLTQVLRSRRYLTPNVSETYEVHIYCCNEILIGSYALLKGVISKYRE